MRTVNIHEAKTHLSRLVEDAARGAEIVIAKAGKPMVRLVPYAPARKRRKLGILDGRFVVPDDLDSPLPDDLVDEFER
jgi:prevent-host-death family protein